MLAEIVKTILGRGEEPHVYFWRTSAGVEVDILVETGGRIVPIEVKLSATPRLAMADAIRTLTKDFGDRVEPGYVVHPGSLRQAIAPNVTALPFAEL